MSKRIGRKRGTGVRVKEAERRARAFLIEARARAKTEDWEGFLKRKIF